MSESDRVKNTNEAFDRMREESERLAAEVNRRWLVREREAQQLADSWAGNLTGGIPAGAFMPPQSLTDSVHRIMKHKFQYGDSAYDGGVLDKDEVTHLLDEVSHLYDLIAQIWEWNVSQAQHLAVAYNGLHSLIEKQSPKHRQAERDKWVYEQLGDGVHWNNIIERLREIAEERGWGKFRARKSVYDCVRRHQRNNPDVPKLLEDE